MLQFNRRALTIGAVVLVAGLAALLAVNLHRDYDRAVRLTTGTCQNLTLLLSQQIGDFMRQADMVLLSMTETVERQRPASRDDFEALLERRRRMLPPSSRLEVFDARGDHLAGEKAADRRINVADRDYFIALQDHPAAGLIIGRPIYGRITGSWMVPFARAVRGPDGEFDGVAVVRVELAFLQSLFASLDLGRNGVVALRDRDLRLVVRHPEPQTYGISVGQQPKTEIVWDLVREGRTEAVFQSLSSVDGIERIFAMRRLGDHSPFYLFVGQSLTDALTEWHRTLRTSVVMLLLFAAGTIFFVRLLNRSWKAQEFALQEVQEGRSRYESIIAAMSEGVLVQTADGRVVAHNPAAVSVLGDFPPAVSELSLDAPGWRIVGEDGQPFPPEQLPWRVALAGGGAQDSVVLGLARPEEELRWISVNARPISPVQGESPHAVVTTLTDVTGRKQAESERLLATSVYRASGEAILVVDAEHRVLSVNPAFTRITGYDIAEVVGQVPLCLVPQKEDAGRSLFDCLLPQADWQGEVWCRHRGGKSFPAWATVSTLPAEEGDGRTIVIFSDVSERKEAAELIWRQANFDDLTGLPNRRLLRDRLQQEIRLAQRRGSMGALLFIDLDRFKEINDTLGHLLGDQLLKEAASRLTGCLRSSDTVARFGGDEFAVVLPQLSAATQPVRVAGKILDTLSVPFRLGIDVAHISASIGITVFPNEGAEVETLFKNADQAMYSAKEKGRNTFAFFTPEMQLEIRERQQLHNDLRLALQGDRFEVHYQPIFDLRSGRMNKAEALMRWWHPQRQTYISPNLFIPLAEDFGLICALGAHVFRAAAVASREWLDAGLGPLEISINMSPQQFAAAEAPQIWLDWLRDSGLPENLVTLEITERLLLDEREETLGKLRRCREAGMRVAIDDFGTGFSSLAYLKKFDIDYLKIDKSFIHDLDHDSNDRALVEAIIVMAHKLGLSVIAEGVETAEQRDFLRQAGCDFAQGYYFARPMPGEAMTDFLRKGRV